MSFVNRSKTALLSLLSIVLFLVPCSLYSQFSVETSGIISSDSTTPFWFQSNQSGIYSGEGSQFLANFQYHDSYDEFEKIKFLYGTSFIARPGEQSTLTLNQGYLKIQGFGFEFAGGRFIDTSPLYEQPLGMGSLGISTNASPIPKLKFGLKDWAGVPFTNNFLQVQGYIAHGWLGSQRYTDDVLLHEKAGYLRVGGEFPVNLYGGLVHYVQWGGNNHPREGDIPNRFSDFINIFLAKGGDESTPGPDQAYVLGNQLGTWTFGSFIDLQETKVNLYMQSPIETKYNLKLKNIRDVLTGISVDLPENSTFPINSFVYEYLYTKHQAGTRRLDPNANPNVDNYRGNQNYYNHQTYRTGWAYNFRTIGNPLFKADQDTLGILNNRIVAHHVGIESGIGDDVSIYGKITYSRNYGKRCDNRIPPIGEEELFGIQCDDEVTLQPGRSLEQWSFLAGTEFPLPIIPNETIFLRIEAAIDNGLLFGDQFGVLTSIKWTP